MSVLESCNDPSLGITCVDLPNDIFKIALNCGRLQSASTIVNSDQFLKGGIRMLWIASRKTLMYAKKDRTPVKCWFQNYLAPGGILKSPTATITAAKVSTFAKPPASLGTRSITNDPYEYDY